MEKLAIKAGFMTQRQDISKQNDGRQNLRLKFLSQVHFSTEQIDPKLGPSIDSDSLQAGLTQNFSAHGLQILSSRSLHQGQNVQIFIPIAPYGIIPIQATVQWSSIDTQNPNSPYWLKSGLKINYSGSKIKKTVLSYLKEQFQKEQRRLAKITH